MNMERGSPSDRQRYLLFPRFDALSGLIFALACVFAAATCVAILHLLTFHLRPGSGQAEQYHPEVYWVLRPQPSHCSTISWQIPPL